MGKNKFTDTQKDMLKVAKLNQKKSEALLAEMDSCNKLWENINQDTEDFLTSMERMLGVTKSGAEVNVEDLVKARTQDEPIWWDDLVEEANAEIDYDVDFEDLLTSEEFENAYKHMDEIDKAFEKKTGLKKQDFAFLNVAIALQCARQYILDPWLKANRVEAGKDDEKGRKNNTQPGWYYVPTDKILTNKVPFDAQRYANNASIQGFLKGGDHRLMTLGHDPILGWIFGTANIMTSTLTRTDLASAHVKCVNNENEIFLLASTLKIFEAVFERVSQEGMDGKIALAYAIVREAIHLKSDINTKRSLPLPVVGIFSTELGKKLAKYGIDMASVSTEESFSWLINMIIAMIHRLGMDERKEKTDLYEVRTRKIILYSNLIASTSNIIASVFLKKYNLSDVGGHVMTISSLMTNLRFICKVKEEFVQGKLDKNFAGIQREVDELYQRRFT